MPTVEAPRQQDHHEHVTLVRLSLAEGEADAALQRIDACLPGARRGGLLGYVIELLVLRSRAAALAGRRAVAEGALDEALERASVGGYVRPFLQDGAALVPLLMARARRARGAGDAHALQVVAVAEDAGMGGAAVVPERSGDAAVPGEPLTERERTVLRLLAAGNSNKAVARTLGVSVNTVKTHVRTVYAKLGVRSRAELVVRVRDEGLVP